MMSVHILRRGRTFGLVVASALVLSGCNFTPYSLPLPGGADLGDHPYTVKAEFRDALDIVPQGAGRLDGDGDHGDQRRHEAPEEH